MASGGHLTPSTDVMTCQFSLDELRLVVEEAPDRERGIGTGPRRDAEDRDGELGSGVHQGLERAGNTAAARTGVAVARIAGGVVGGVAALALIGALIYWGAAPIQQKKEAEPKS